MWIQNRRTDRGTGTDKAGIEREANRETCSYRTDGQIEGLALTELELREGQTGKLVATEDGQTEGQTRTDRTGT